MQRCLARLARRVCGETRPFRNADFMRASSPTASNTFCRASCNTACYFKNYDRRFAEACLKPQLFVTSYNSNRDEDRTYDALHLQREGLLSSAGRRGEEAHRGWRPHAAGSAGSRRSAPRVARAARRGVTAPRLPHPPGQGLRRSPPAAPPAPAPRPHTWRWRRPRNFSARAAMACRPRGPGGERGSPLRTVTAGFLKRPHT